MSVRIFPKARQGQGAFNGGEIVENKPIGFPQDGSEVRPYSNLFYWAHARAVKDSTIGLHPHQGFEICSFVLEGQIRHYDTKLQDWKPLEAGDVQIIRAGNGISHSEWMGQNAEIFQIWFDPDLTKTLSKPASYDDYRGSDFPVSHPAEGIRVTTLAGAGSPFQMDTPGVRILRIALDKTSYEVELAPGQIVSAYVLSGETLFNGDAAQTSDFILVAEEGKIHMETQAAAEVFLIISPAMPGYRTYSQIRRMQAA